MFFSLNSACENSKIENIKLEGKIVGMPLYSTDGKWLVYMRIDSTKTTFSSIHKYNRITKVSSELVKKDDLTYSIPLTWSPDGKWLLYAVLTKYQTRQQSDYQLWKINIDNLQSQRMISQNWDLTIGATWSSDSKLFFKGAEGISEISSQGAGILVFCDKSYGLNFIKISPDGRNFLLSDGQYRGPVWLMENKKACEPKKLVDSSLWGACWSPDSKFICYSQPCSGSEAYNLVISPINDLYKKIPLTSCTAMDLFPDWSSNGEKIAFTRVFPAGSSLSPSIDSAQILEVSVPENIVNEIRLTRRN